MGQKIGPFRVVLDTNVLVSSLLFTSEKWSWLRNGWSWGRIVPLVCKTTTVELIRVLNYPKFRLSHAEQQIILETFLPFVETHPDPPPAPALPACRDPKDQIFLELASSTTVDYLISGDADLLDYPAPAELIILPPAKFFHLIHEV